MGLPTIVCLFLAAPADAEDRHVGLGQTYLVLQDAVDDALPGDRLVVHAGTYGPVVLGASIEVFGVDGADATTIRADGAVAVSVVAGTPTLRGLTLDGLGVERVLDVTGGGVVVEDAVLRDGFGTQGGCGRLVDVTTVLRRTTISGCVATDGGGLYVDGGTVSLQAVTVEDNVATDGRGGGIFVTGAGFTATGAVFLSNVVDDPNGVVNRGLGGGLYGASASMTVSGSRFEENEARSIRLDGGVGGALRAFQSTLSVTGSVFDDNVADDRGSGVAGEAAPSFVTVSGSRFDGNRVDASDGGAFFCRDGATCVVDRSWFEDNVAQDGAAIGSESDLTVSTSMFCRNEATDDGGAMDLGILEPGGVVAVTGSVFANNDAGDDGGALVVTGGAVRILNNHFVDNAASSGGAVALSGGTGLFGLTVVGNLFVDNQAGPGEVTVELAADPYAEGFDWFFDNGPADLDVAYGFGTVSGLDPALGSVSSCGEPLAPAAGSGLVDAGDPTILDGDGSISDIGAFGGPTADLGAFDDRDGDTSAEMVDCDDGDSSRNVDAIEVCNGEDDDCDGLVDAEDAVVGGAWLHLDGDGDGFGNPAVARFSCPAADWVANGVDCDDLLPNVGEGTTHYVDHDGDGFGDPQLPIVTCGSGPGITADGSDCDDLNPGVGGPREWAVDADGDGHGIGGVVADCGSPGAGWTQGPADDCDDGNAQTWPGAVEQCNEVDDDCNGAVDDDVVDVNWWPDADRDLYGSGSPVLDCRAPGQDWAAADGDCDDAEPTVNPGEAERCGGVDEDCDGLFDADDPDLDPTTVLAHFPDRDDDGFGDGAATPVLACEGPDGTAPNGTDCDDGAPGVNPGEVDVPLDGVDQDCDGVDASVAEGQDTDGDGLTDVVEDAIGSDPTDVDSDDDGLGDGAEGVVDSDGDGLADPIDPDDDGDGHPTVDEGATDLDGDGVPNHLDDDSDGDGALDRAETDAAYLDAGGSTAEAPEVRYGCGCDGVGAGPSWVFGVLLVVIRRRAKARHPSPPPSPRCGERG